MNLSPGISVLLAVLLVAVDSSADSSPFVALNQNPFVAAHGLARDFGARLTPTDRLYLSSAYSIASQFEIVDQGPELITIDGESTRAELRLLWGVRPGWELGVELTHIGHKGGFLDDLIIDWHDLLGMEQRGRDEFPTDAIRFSYFGRGNTALLDKEVSGIGDMQLFIARQLNKSANSGTVLRGHLKLPTGDESEFLGSGGTDIGLSVHHERALGSRWHAGVWVGATHLGDNRILPGLSRSMVLQGGLRAGIALNDSLTLKVQWDAHTQVYKNTGLRQLKEIGYNLSFGGTLRLGGAHALDIVVMENYPHPEISPDVTFQFHWRWTPAKAVALSSPGNPPVPWCFAPG